MFSKVTGCLCLCPGHQEPGTDVMLNPRTVITLLFNGDPAALSFIPSNVYFYPIFDELTVLVL